jgi:transcriptional regulator with XRE-family HTH domain
MSVKSSRSALPLPVRRALGQLGGNLALARRRRRISTQSMAERLQISTATLRRLERGDPSLSVGTLAKALLVLRYREHGLSETRAPSKGLNARRLLSGSDDGHSASIAFIAGRPTGRPGRFRATYPAPVLRRLLYQWPRVSGEASETPPSPSCAAPGGSFLHVS